MTIREFFLENFAGDLEYHPRRGLLYPGLAIAAECFWIFSSYEARFTAIRLVFLSGGLALLLKGIFLFRKSSEGIGLSLQKATQLPDSTPGKTLPSIPANAAQALQDFGTGSLLLWPLLNIGKDIDPSWDHLPRLTVFASGAVLFAVGWGIRRFASPPVS
ncbi:MAG TPA: hypothetical protein VHT31_06925 [Candidatus Acidoferrum sp.]|nr:hypothetical protein [Candidatus Acidoferrum sp.]